MKTAYDMDWVHCNKCSLQFRANPKCIPFSYDKLHAHYKDMPAQMRFVFQDQIPPLQSIFKTAQFRKSQWKRLFNSLKCNLPILIKKNQNLTKSITNVQDQIQKLEADNKSLKNRISQKQIQLQENKKRFSTAQKGTEASYILPMRSFIYEGYDY
ncbi:unnamed protein product [Lepeophtheirus salmonis]|uniref:(salmon louse) hypothetical protein n=1 Tax=Lepeophtheirus salmonis TaxID=72036 RepID=A0A7R8CHE8_LEPSM|nr:unnamed protein product [Lepeophtheirus salmonis]CAF2823501.1 unnamed protein product [Lepeophtheirus salmonis]